MDLLSNSIREKIEEIDNKIQQITYMQEFDKANAFREVLEQVKKQIQMMGEVESQTHLYYPQAMDALEAINLEIDDYMEKEGKTKKQELNRTIFLEKLKRFINDTKGRNTETMLSDLKGIVKEVKDLELEENLFSEFNSLTAKALLSTFVKQAQKEEEIDLGLVEEITTKGAFVKEMQAQLVEMAEEQKEDKVAAYDILKVCQEVKEEKIGDSKIWETLSGNAEVKLKQPEPKKELPAEVPQETQLISLEPAKRTIFDRLRDRFVKKRWRVGLYIWEI